MSRHVFISGASGNLGKAVVAHFRTAGYKVSTVDQHPVPDTNHYQVDLTNEADTRKAVVECWNHKPIDLALFLAGGFAMGTLETTTSDDIQHQLKLNFTTAANCAIPLLPLMKNRGTGRMIFIGARPGFDVRLGTAMAAYALSKSLIFRLQELVEASGVKTAVIVPGTIDTPANRASMPNADTSKWVLPETLASTMHWLDTPEGLATTAPILPFY